MAPDVIGEFRRHDLVHVAPAAWAAMLAERPDLQAAPHVGDWAASGRPLIVRRFTAGEARDRIPLGLPLPPADGKRRISFAFPAADLAHRPAPRLQDARASAPTGWHASLDAVIALGAEYGIVPRPFGGLLWQTVTGLPYLTSASDLDVFWPLANASAPTGLLARIARIAETAPMRLDGEIVLPDGAGIHWRELFEAAEGGEVLAKSLDRLEMRPVASLRTAPQS